MQAPSPRFKILALAPFDMNPSRTWTQPPLAVTRQELDTALSAMEIDHFLSLDASLCRPGGFEIEFRNLKSLHPDGMIKNIPFFHQVESAKQMIRDARKDERTADDIARGLTQWPDLPPIRVKDPKPGGSSRRRASALDNILEMVAAPGEDPQQSAVYQDELSQLDAIQSHIIANVFSMPGFRRMEAAWRGLRLLLQQGTVDNAVRVEIAPAHRDNLEATMAELLPFLIQDPPNLILLDLPVDNSPADMNLLAKAAEWASTLLVPLVVWAPSAFLQISAWKDLSTLPFLPNHIEEGAYAKYRALKQSQSGHWVCMTCNRFLIRYPYGRDNPPRHVRFTESEPLWISPTWGLGTLAACNLEQTGWPTRFTDQQQYQIQDLAVADPHAIPPVVVEAVLSRDRMDQLIRCGLTPLTAATGKDFAFVPKAVTIAGGSLAHQLLTGQITAFILWCKDHLPAETHPAELESLLHRAIQSLGERSRPNGFDAIDISTGDPDNSGRIPTRISITPAASTLPGQRKIELALDW